MTPTEILTFWFEELTPKQRFAKDKNLDELIVQRYMGIHTRAVNSELEHWRQTPQGRLAEIIVLDQFSRNMFRADARSWQYDSQALALARAAVTSGDDARIEQSRRSFVYMPYMQSESKEVHEEAIVLFENLGNEETLKYEILHKNIIDRFGRYPHRNKVLGRDSTPAELEYLKNNRGF